jgi:hypothetical protein
MNASALSPREALVYRELEAAATEGILCPTNAALARRIDAASSEASYLIRGLENKGFIRVERFNRARRIMIVPTGKATAMPVGGVLAEPAVTGAELADQILVHAQRTSVTLTTLLEPLSTDPSKWLNQLRAARRPKRSTVERIQALLEGRDVPRPPANNFQTGGGAQAKRKAEPRLDAADFLPRVDRDPCPRCGVRRDIGCAHSTLAISSRISAW